MKICLKKQVAAVLLSFGLPVAMVAAGEPAIAVHPGNASLEWGPCPEFFPVGCMIAVVHGDPAQANADILFRISGGYDIPPHTHSSAERMVLLGGHLEVSYTGQAPVLLEVGTYAYGPAGLSHHGRCLSKEPCMLFIAFEGPVDALPTTP